MVDFNDALEEYLRSKEISKKKGVGTENILRVYELLLYKERTKVLGEKLDELKVVLEKFNDKVEIIKDASDTFIKEYLDRRGFNQ
jgi:hypothetical protein